VVFDGPGQGVHIGRNPMVTDFERVVASVMEQAVGSARPARPSARRSGAHAPRPPGLPGPVPR
ncbi:hypothetical protein ABT112_34870, partial [Streptomyces sp. NPDC002055]|uniref:hypothetical protein n=1 Tax=Streptomyces sp. NPDC002055 TaxID=3154534 RepID=UPI00331DE120